MSLSNAPPHRTPHTRTPRTASFAPHPAQIRKPRTQPEAAANNPLAHHVTSPSRSSTPLPPYPFPRYASLVHVPGVDMVVQKGSLSLHEFGLELRAALAAKQPRVILPPL